jgi:hypothetical protein
MVAKDGIKNLFATYEESRVLRDILQLTRNQTCKLSKFGHIGEVPQSRGDGEM